jgi:hypothetical protein
MRGVCVFGRLYQRVVALFELGKSLVYLWDLRHKDSMDRFYKIFGLALVFFLGPVACEEPIPLGFLEVNAGRDGTFEIYKYGSGDKTVFVSEQVGYFNQPMSLAPGSYLVLADCSSESVVIYPGRSESLTVHSVEFKAPIEPDVNDSFSLQCSRSEETRSRQSLTNRFTLNIIHGVREILVGMVPLTIDFEKLAPEKKPRNLRYELAAVQVAEVDNLTSDATYFVSVTDELIAVTRPQEFGNWEFLLPGVYTLEVNGTTLDIELKKGDQHIVLPSFVTVSVSESVDLDQPSRIKGTPQLVEINTGHWLSFNEVYPVLPGAATLRVSGSSRKLPIELVENELFELKARSLQIDLGCSPWEWTCLGGKDISLYYGDQTYPFIESVSDIPVIFLDQSDEAIYIGIEGSRDIRYKLPKARDAQLKVGYVNIIPEPTSKPGQLTDLVRMETASSMTLGDSLDVDLESTKVMPLISTRFQLAHYVSLTSQEGERRRTVRNIDIRPGKTQTIRMPVYFSEKRLASYRKKKERQSKDEAAKQDLSKASRVLPIDYL